MERCVHYAGSGRVDGRSSSACPRSTTAAFVVDGREDKGVYGKTGTAVCLQNGAAVVLDFKDERGGALGDWYGEIESVDCEIRVPRLLSEEAAPVLCDLG